MIRHVQGDLISLFLSNHFDFIVHGCNCQGRMDAGLARSIANVFPVVVHNDKMLAQLGILPGSAFSVPVDGGVVVNLYTQRFPGANAQLNWVEDSITSFRSIITSTWKKPSPPVIGIPRVGCGIGGLVWEEVMPLFYEGLGDHADLVFVEYSDGRKKPEILTQTSMFGVDLDGGNDD